MLAQNHENPVLSNTVKNLRNLDHMIGDVVDDVEACLQMVVFLLCFAVPKVD